MRKEQEKRDEKKKRKTGVENEESNQAIKQICMWKSVLKTRLAQWRRKWQPTPVLLPGEFHGQRNLVGCCPWGSTELDMTEATLHACMHALEKEMTTHFSILAWRIPGTEEPGGLPSMGSHRVGHDWSDLANTILSMSPTSASTSQERSLLQPC